MAEFQIFKFGATTTAADSTGQVEAISTIERSSGAGWPQAVGSLQDNRPPAVRLG